MRDALRREALRHALEIGSLLMLVLALAWVDDAIAPSGAAVALGLYAAIGAAVVATVPAHRPHRRFGAANTITLLRAGLVAVIGGLAASPPTASALWSAAALALLVLALDGVDGWVARRTGTASAFGARFDMETDTLLMLILSLMLVLAGRVGAWILLSGLARYLFVGAGAAWRWLRAPLPPSDRRRAICVVQGLTLVAALLPVLPPIAASAVAAIGLGVLLLSFAIDVLWLWRHRAGTTEPASCAA